MKPGLHQELISISDVPPEHLPKVLAALLEYFNVAIMREQTPDYTSYYVRPRNAVIPDEP